MCTKGWENDLQVSFLSPLLPLEPLITTLTPLDLLVALLYSLLILDTLPPFSTYNCFSTIFLACIEIFILLAHVASKCETFFLIIPNLLFIPYFYYFLFYPYSFWGLEVEQVNVLHYDIDHLVVKGYYNSTLLWCTKWTTCLQEIPIIIS